MKTQLQVLAFLVLALSVVTACGASSDDTAQSPSDTSVSVDAESTPAIPDPVPEETVVELPLASPDVIDVLPEEFHNLWDPWHGDLDQMIERRAIRVLVPFGGYQYYFVRGRPRGAIVELLEKMELFINKELKRRNIRVYVVAIPVSRDHLIRYLLEGHGDLVAADLTVTDARKREVQFSRPLLKDINEVIITGPSSPQLDSLDDLAGREIVVRESSSYYEHLQRLSESFVERDLEPPIIKLSDELLEAEDLLEMLNAGLIPLTVLDDYKAEFWASVFPEITVRSDLSINDNGVIAWAMNPERKDLAAFVERFLRKNGRGTLVGNDAYNRYLANASRVRCAQKLDSLGQQSDLVAWLKMYGEEYDFDWLMLAAQGYQESRLRQARKSAAGAIGVMQIKPSTAADKNVGIPDVTGMENNIHAGTKYMRFLSDRYFSEDVDETNRWFFSLAAYNAGPARVIRLRNEARKEGLDPNRWFGNVEIIAARRIGRETVGYVSSIYKYYIGYKMSEARSEEQHRRHADDLVGCSE